MLSRRKLPSVSSLRQFLKSTELFESLEAECRRKRPREEGGPEWLEGWRNEVDSLDLGDEETDLSAGSYEGEVLGAAANPQNEGERRINILRGSQTTTNQNVDSNEG